MSIWDIQGQLSDVGSQIVRGGTYALQAPNLLHMERKPGHNFRARPGGQAVDEIVLHGTESTHPEAWVLDYLASANSDSVSIHYFIGRDFGALWSVVPEDKQAFHAGNPKGYASVQDHNPRSIGIEMYQQNVSMFGGDKTKLDFTDWQYETCAMLCYDICRRRGIKKNKVVSHGSVNSIQRADPQGFDWPRFNKRLDGLSTTLSASLGADFGLS